MVLAILEMHRAVGSIIAAADHGSYVVQNIGNGVALNVRYHFTRPNEVPAHPHGRYVPHISPTGRATLVETIGGYNAEHEVLMLFRLAVAAQEKDASPIKSQLCTADAVQQGAFPASSHGDPSFEQGVSTLPASQPVPDVRTQEKRKPTQSSKPPGEQRPRIPGSMVGYIDNATVKSQIRIRDDAAFHDNAPDRAEFFYARYNSLNNMRPGPPFVVADLNFQQLYLHAEYAPFKRFSFLGEVPVRWIQPQLTVANTESQLLFPMIPNVNEAGLSDVAVGFKLAAIASSNQYLTLQFQAYFPSGNASMGLGTNHYSVEPALLYYRRLSDRAALEAQVGDSHPIGGSSCLLPCKTDSMETHPPKSEGFAGDIFFYGVGPSYVLYRGEHVRIAPVIELVGWRVLGGFETNCVPSVFSCSIQEAVSADGTNIVNLKVGVRTLIGKHNSFYVGFGQALTHSVWYEHIVRAEYRYSF